MVYFVFFHTLNVYIVKMQSEPQGTFTLNAETVKFEFTS